MAHSKQLYWEQMDVGKTFSTRNVHQDISRSVQDRQQTVKNAVNYLTD